MYDEHRRFPRLEGHVQPKFHGSHRRSQSSDESVDDGFSNPPHFHAIRSSGIFKDSESMLAGAKRRATSREPDRNRLRGHL